MHAPRPSALAVLLTLAACQPRSLDTGAPTCTPTHTTITPGTTEALPLRLPLVALLCPTDGTPCTPTTDYTVTRAGLVTITAPDWAAVVVWSLE